MLPSLAALPPQQAAHLVGISEYALAGVLMLGDGDDQIALAGYHYAFWNGFWSELTFAPTSIRHQAWPLKWEPASALGVAVAVDLGLSEPVKLVPTVKQRPEGPPKYDHTETYAEDPYAGTRLTAHFFLYIQGRDKHAS